MCEIILRDVEEFLTAFYDFFSKGNRRYRIAWFRSVAFSLARCRFSVILLLVGMGLLLSDQGQDVIVANGEDSQIISLLAAGTLWASSIWFWSRMLLDVRWHGIPSREYYYIGRIGLPRILGSAAFLVFAISAGMAGQHILAALSFISFLVFLAVVIWRRDMMNSLNKSYLSRVKIEKDTLHIYEDFFEMIGISEPSTELSRQGRIARKFITLTLIVMFILLAAMGSLYPVLWMETGMGALVLFFLWAATWLPIGSAISCWGDRRGWPVLTLLILLALASSVFNDNHEIRKLAGNDFKDDRPSVSRALHEWYGINGRDGEKVPFVVVATAGGGIRAAYWTSTVLGEIHDKYAENSEKTGSQAGNPAFSDKVFAISGVSGGSVGATVYRRLLDMRINDSDGFCIDPDNKNNKFGPKSVKNEEKENKINTNSMADCGRSVFDSDLLSPLVAALLYPDLVQRFFPFPVFPSRGTAFEKGLEYAFESVTDDRIKLDESLVKLYMDNRNVSLAEKKEEDMRWKPALFLNSTWSDNGRRIVASSLKFGEEKNEKEVFKLANDEIAILGHDIRLSTAAHNSARFPYVSPPGMWKINKNNKNIFDPENNKNDDEIVGRLQDGGLFENYGAETAMEILKLACEKFSCGDKKEVGKEGWIKPVVVLISSDPTLPPELADSPKDNKPISFGYEVRSTLRTYERVRGGRGAELAATLEDYAHKIAEVKKDDQNKKDAEEVFYYFRMCKKNGNGGDDPPLGWALSGSARDTIKSYLEKDEHDSCRMGNVDALGKLLSALKGGPSRT